jgi:D-tyrosyl-tRNA(Tyr) deacylase
MRAVCQRVSKARVTIDGEVHGEIERGLVVLLGVERGDDSAEAARLAGKVARLRIFAGDTGKFDRSVKDVGGGALIVSQFTLVADTTRPTGTASEGWKPQSGNRPSFTNAAPASEAEPIYAAFCDAVEAEGVPVERGLFGAHMVVEIVNDGPVTIVLDTA